jgi:hypothetical protein
MAGTALLRCISETARQDRRDELIRPPLEMIILNNCIVLANKDDQTDNACNQHRQRLFFNGWAHTLRVEPFVNLRFFYIDDAGIEHDIGCVDETGTFALGQDTPALRGLRAFSWMRPTEVCREDLKQAEFVHRAFGIDLHKTHA